MMLLYKRYTAIIMKPCEELHRLYKEYLVNKQYLTYGEVIISAIIKR